MELSDKIKALIAKARIVDVQQWIGQVDEPYIAMVQAADDAGRYLTNEDFEALQVADYPYMDLSRLFRDQASDIVDEARNSVLVHFPGITEPGGGLYPAVRAEACWRDFWHFLRCITYGVTFNQVTYTSEMGLGAMEQLYKGLQVPLDAMVFGLEGIKDASLNRIPGNDRCLLAPFFDHLIEKLQQF